MIGENIDEVMSLTKSAHKVLQQASTEVCNYVPDDFHEIVLKVFQTSSQPQFNAVFVFEESQACHHADKRGGVAKCPSVTATCTLALNTYWRMTGPGDECVWCQAPPQGAAFNVEAGQPAG